MQKLRTGLCSPAHSNVVINLRMCMEHGHSMMHIKFQSHRDLFACKHCGRYAARQFRGLHKPCSTHPRAHSWKRVFVFGCHLLSRKDAVISKVPVQVPMVLDPLSVHVPVLGRLPRRLGPMLLSHALIWGLMIPMLSASRSQTKRFARPMLVMLVSQNR